MNPKIILPLILFFVTLTCNAQKNESINQTDAKGLKQGHWIKKNPQGHPLYEGYFKDNKPTGTFKRFYDNDSLQAVLIYGDDNKHAEATFYHQNGFLASKGNYINQLREGKWKFFSAEISGYLICEEVYLNNKKHGLSIKYYPDKTLLEKLNYVNDVKSGEWVQYFPDGKICLSGFYTDGRLNGKFVVYYDNGNKEFAGQYTDNARNGDWIRYNSDGSVKTTIHYVSGLATNPELHKQETEYLDALERNKGKIADPEKTGTLWQ